MDNERLDLPAAPAAPVPEPLMREEAPQPAPAPAPKKVRRVGTFTMGLCLVIAGLALTVGMFRPGTDFTFLFKLAPLVLVALGVEVLVASATAREQKLKYDFLSMFVCFLLILCTAAAAVCTPLVEYYGPQRQARINELRTAWNDALYERLAGEDGVYKVQGGLWTEAPVLPAELDLESISRNGSVWVDVTLDGSYADEMAFAEACRKLIPAVTGAGVENPTITFRTLESQNRPVRYILEVQSAWLRNKDAAGLAQAVETLHWNEEQGYYMDDEEWADWQQDRLAYVT